MDIPNFCDIREGTFPFLMHGNRSSRTAEYMAFFRALEDMQPLAHRLFSDRFAVTLLRSSLKAVAVLAQWMPFRQLFTLLLDKNWPRARSSAVVRTKLIDDLLPDAFASGSRQLVLLGAGFDTRPYRLPEARQLKTFEVDHPATQAAKVERLGQNEATHTELLRYVPVDFEQDDLESSLLDAGYDPNVGTLVIWEGVVSYLSASAVDGTFRVLARLLSPGGRVIFTYVDLRATDGSQFFPEAKRWTGKVRSTGEPFIFGFLPHELDNYARKRGFTLWSDVTTADAATQYNASFGRSETGSDMYRVAVFIRNEADQLCQK
jgi:methyltransferase (TIGR00027 family)